MRIMIVVRDGDHKELAETDICVDIHGDIVDIVMEMAEPISQIGNLSWEPQFYNTMPHVLYWCV